MEGVLYDVRGRVARVTLSRPEVLNAVNEDVLQGLAEAISAVGRTPSVRALVIRGSGGAFCVGLDTELLKRAFADHGYFRDVLVRYNKVLLDVERLDVPVIAAVDGVARAGGFELLLACDLVVAAEDARIGDVHTRFGVMPGGGSTHRAIRKLGDQRARELIFTSRWLSGAEAAGYGIAMRAVPPAGLDAAVDELVASLIDKPRSCLAAVKAAIRESQGLPAEAAVDVEIEHFMRYLDKSPDAGEGFRAYLEGRPPSWA
jgi:enoyl-CoA hydratase/carnithine racemase